MPALMIGSRQQEVNEKSGRLCWIKRCCNLLGLLHQWHAGACSGKSLSGHVFDIRWPKLLSQANYERFSLACYCSTECLITLALDACQHLPSWHLDLATPLETPQVPGPAPSHPLPEF